MRDAITVDMLLDMELGRAQQRILRAFLRAPDGLTRREVLLALYADDADMSRKVREGESDGTYVLAVLRGLREALQYQDLWLVVTEWHRSGGARRPYRWALSRDDIQEPGPGVKLPHVVAAPAVEAACRELGHYPLTVVRALARAGYDGMSGQELVEWVYPETTSRPRDPINCVQQHVLAARRALARQHLAIVARPRAGTAARRYLVRTR